jgi:serine protease Do
MTVGIISALGRSLPVDSASSASGATYTIPDIIQTDAPINPGNSGGVLVDDQGRVIGVTAAIESPVEGSAGIGFAIPSLVVQRVVPSLIETGHFSHPYIGISGMTLTSALAEAMGLDAGQRGVLVGDVTPDSPADKAGLRGSDRQVEIEDQAVRVGGDVIVAIDGPPGGGRQPVREFDDLTTYLARYTQVGQTVTLTVLREGAEEKVDLTLAPRPNQETGQNAQGNGETTGASLGIVGLTLSPEIAQAMDLPSDQAGVLVEAVQQGSPADEAGLRGSYKMLTLNGQDVRVGGDVIIAIDDQPLASMDELSGYLQQAEPGQRVTLTLLRDGERVEVAVTLAE